MARIKALGLDAAISREQARGVLIARCKAAMKVMAKKPAELMIFELAAAMRDIARQPEGDEETAQAVARAVLKKLGL